MVDPRLPEQHALFLVTGRVVGDGVQELVDDLERAREVRRHFRQVAHRRSQLLDRRQRRAREVIAQFVANRCGERAHGRGAEEPAGCVAGGGEGGGVWFCGEGEGY